MPSLPPLPSPMSMPPVPLPAEPLPLAEPALSTPVRPLSELQAKEKPSRERQTIPGKTRFLFMAVPWWRHEQGDTFGFSVVIEFGRSHGRLRESAVPLRTTRTLRTQNDPRCFRRAGRFEHTAVRSLDRNVGDDL